MSRALFPAVDAQMGNFGLGSGKTLRGDKLGRRLNEVSLRAVKHHMTDDTVKLANGQTKPARAVLPPGTLAYYYIDVGAQQQRSIFGDKFG